MTPEEATEKAVRGLILLRGKGINPRNHIDDLSLLNINSPCGCVLGRIYGSFESGLGVLELVDDTILPLGEVPEPTDDQRASYYGFCLRNEEYVKMGHEGYELLTEAWIDVLTHARVAPETSPVVE